MWSRTTPIAPTETRLGVTGCRVSAIDRSQNQSADGFATVYANAGLPALGFVRKGGERVEVFVACRNDRSLGVGRNVEMISLLESARR